MRAFLLTTSMALLATLIIGCGSDTPDESAVVASLTDSIVVPGYVATADASSELRQALESLCIQPSDDTLTNAQQAWRDARAPWKRTEATWFGPVMDRRSVGLVDWPEIEPDRIEAMLADNPVASEADARDRLASTQRGFGAVEYLLFDPDALDLLSDRSSGRCDFLVALGQVIASEADAILTAWTQETDGFPAYGDYLTGRSTVSLLTSEATAEFVRTQVFLIRTLVDLRLAAALGLREGGADLSAIPGGEGRSALHDLRNQVVGMRDIYVGPGGPDGLGISDLVRGLSSETDERMREHFAGALDSIDAVALPLRTAVVEQPDRVQLVHEELTELRRTLNTEVVSLLGVSVGFSDTDGDSMR